MDGYNTMQLGRSGFLWSDVNFVNSSRDPFSEVRRIGVGLDGERHEGGWIGYRGVEEAE